MENTTEEDNFLEVTEVVELVEDFFRGHRGWGGAIHGGWNLDREDIVVVGRVDKSREQLVVFIHNLEVIFPSIIIVSRYTRHMIKNLKIK